MEPLERVREVWDRLPEFRTVAETEHLGRAAERLHVSPPALSRNLKLLEEALGLKLFTRRGRGLQLNDEGRLLLARVRDAMRWVEDGLAALESRDREGVVRIGTLGVAAQVHVPELVARLLREQPGLVPQVSTPPADEVADRLLQGRLDLVVGSAAVSHAELTTIRLADVTNSVYCGPGHPLHGAAEPTRAQLLEHAFVAPPRRPSGVTDEGWPPELPRRVACELDRMRAGLEICAAGGLLAVLPDVLARRHPADLRALRAVAIPNVPVHAVRRRALGGRDRTDLVLEVLTAIDAELSGPGPPDQPGRRAITAAKPNTPR